MRTLKNSRPILAAAALSLLGPLGCAAGPAAQDARAEDAQAGVTRAAMPASLANIPGIRRPKAGLYTAAQPAPEQWRDIAQAGVTTVINLRPDAELAQRDERAEVDAAGLRYVQLPVAGADDINAQQADALMQALQQADGPVLVHCASGNRVGALLALGAARAGMPVEAAIAYGRSAGLGSAEAVVRQQLKTAAADDAAQRP